MRSPPLVSPGFQAAKRTDELIPLLPHPSPSRWPRWRWSSPRSQGRRGGGEERAGALPEGAPREARVRVVARARGHGADGGGDGGRWSRRLSPALTLYDFCKSLERGVRVEGIALLEKERRHLGALEGPALEGPSPEIPALAPFSTPAPCPCPCPRLPPAEAPMPLLELQAALARLGQGLESLAASAAC